MNHSHLLSAKRQLSRSKTLVIAGTFPDLIQNSFCEEDFVVTGYAGEFINAISSVAYGTVAPP